jgi:hypothetical protein
VGSQVSVKGPCGARKKGLVVGEIFATVFSYICCVLLMDWICLFMFEWQRLKYKSIMNISKKRYKRQVKKIREDKKREGSKRDIIKGLLYVCVYVYIFDKLKP